MCAAPAARRIPSERPLTDEPFNASQQGLTLAKALEAKGVPYALGGALAYGVWAVSRATNDVDRNVFPAPEARSFWGDPP